MLPLAYQIKSYIKEIFSCICRKGFNIDDNNKKYHKARDHCHCNEKCRRAAHSICNLRYKTPKIGPTYDYHFIIKQLAKKLEGQFECIGENTQKYLTFSVRIKNELDNRKTIKDKLKFIDYDKLIIKSC